MPSPTSTIPQLQSIGAGTVQGASPSYPQYVVPQYGVDMPQNANVAGGNNVDISALSGALPFIGSILSFVGNYALQNAENERNEMYYNKYMSPKARMAQMRAAGINPAAAAEGISGSSAPTISAASPTNSLSGLAEVLGGSVNTGLTASLIKSQTEKNKSESDLTKSLNVEQDTKNKYADSMQNATLRKLINEGDITKHQANIIAVDDYYHGAEAAAHLEQTYLSIDKMAAELQNEQQQYFNLLAQEYATMMQGDLSRAQINKVFSDIGLNDAQIEKISHEIDNIDAETLATIQYTSESQVRERLTRAQAQYSEKVYTTWNNSGFNVNSDVNSNFMRLCMEGNIEEATTLLNGTKAMILNTGNARFHSKDYMFDKSMDIIGSSARLLGGVSGIK